MPAKERTGSLQYNFEGELVDNRSKSQRKRDRERTKPRQAEMFPQREMAQFGVKPNPKLPISPKTSLELAMEDLKTEEEIEQERMKAAQELTYSLFDDQKIIEESPAEGASRNTIAFPSGITLPLVSPEDAGREPCIRLFSELLMVLWSTPDQAFERLELMDWHRGYKGRRVGEWQLEVRGRDLPGFFLVTYSDMGMIENVEWIDETHR